MKADRYSSSLASGCRGAAIAAQKPTRPMANTCSIPFLTTAPNEVVKPVHPKAMPVLLLDEAVREVWLTGSIDEALALQRPAAEDAVRIVATGAKQDGQDHPPT
jgi:putative SOS response-associated peptidase YedK